MEIFKTVAEYLGLAPPEVPVVPPGADDVPSVVLDPKATEERLGWRAEVSFQDTIRRQLAWYDQHGVSDIYSHLRPGSGEG